MARKADFFDDPDTLWIRVGILWVSATFGSPIVIMAARWPKWLALVTSVLFGIGIPIIFFFAWRARRKEHTFFE